MRDIATLRLSRGGIGHPMTRPLVCRVCAAPRPSNPCASCGHRRPIRVKAGDVIEGTESGKRADGSSWSITDRLRILYAGHGVILALRTHQNGKRTRSRFAATWCLDMRDWKRIRT